MKIKRFEVIGLLGRDKPLKVEFNDDINILTGRNGSGKTSALKLLWFIVSGNILLALKEVSFKKAFVETVLYECTIYKLTQYTCKISWKDSSGEYIFEDGYDEDNEVVENAEDQANSMLVELGSSVFLPTFRRIEGGFTISDKTTNALSRARSDIEESMSALSKKLSRGNHAFVASLSTIDIVSLLVRQYTDMSEEYNLLQQKTSHNIISKIKDFKRDQVNSNQLASADEVLDGIRQQIEGMEGAREEIMKPLSAVTSLVTALFRHSGINLSKNLSFGDAANAVNSVALSAGEKQMLSFIAYNAFYQNATIIIDEPELSLHVDWQRQLFPILRSQHSSNQFIIATHSPFIYSKYPDKEIQIDSDRGDDGSN